MKDQSRGTPDATFVYSTIADHPLPGVSPTYHGPKRVQISLCFLAEGAANVVYRFTPTEPDDVLPTAFQDKLLRLRKDTESAMAASTTLLGFQKYVVPLFHPRNLVGQTLFSDPGPRLLDDLNQALATRRAHGREAHQGRYSHPLATDDGILVTDMTPRDGDEFLLEFKPKWLLQSPSAPAGATRCRTCALGEMRRAKRGGKAVLGRGTLDFCPLDLLSSEDGVLRKVIGALPFHLPQAESTEREAALLTFFRSEVQPLLFRLRELQAEYGRVGMEDFQDQEAIDISLAVNSDDTRGTWHQDGVRMSIGMALRDCSVLVRYRDRGGGDGLTGEVRLADLDLKPVTGPKLTKWATTEKELAELGWYVDG